MKRFYLVVLPFFVLFCFACGPKPIETTSKPTSPQSTSIPEETTPSLAGKVGASCQSEIPFGQGNCEPGLICGPLPGGYCTTLSDFSGNCDGTWAESSRAGEICAQTCEQNSDCRVEEGYQCDQDWKACALPGFLAPVAPQCNAPVLAKNIFGTSQQISSKNGPGRYHLEPSAALDKSGNLTAVYIARGLLREENSLAVSTIDTKGKIDQDRALQSDRENHFDPWMARDRKGKLYVVWLGFNGGGSPEKQMQIGLSTSTDGKTWSTPVAANDIENDCPNETPGCLDKPMIAIGPNKNNRKKDSIYVFYFSAVTEGMRMTRSTDGGKTFSESIPVGAGAYGDAEVSSDGNIHTVFIDSNPKGQQRPNLYGDTANIVSYTRSSDGGKTFSKPVQVSGPKESIPFFFSNPQVVSDPKRKTLYVVYPSGTPDGRWDIMLATSKDNGLSWSRSKINDDKTCANHMTPTIALNEKTGRVHIVWTENRSGAGQVVYTLCEKDGKTCSPNEKVSDEPFASYSLARHTPKWLGEYYSLIIDSKRNKLHLVWTQTIKEDDKPIARIFYAEGKLDK